MNRLAALLASACLLAPGAVLAAGCGADDVERVAGVDVAQAAERTAAKGTARMRMTMKMTGAGLPQPVTVKANGVMALDAARGRLGIDLGTIAQSFGAPLPEGAATVEMVFEGSRFNAKLPTGLPGVPALPGGASWVQLDLKEVATAMGLDADGLGALFTLDPAAQLKAIDATRTLKKVGTETIGGASTTHYAGTYKLSDFIAGLPEAQRKAVQDSVDKLDELSAGGEPLALDDPIPVELWVDADGVARKVLSASKLPAQKGVPAGTLEQSYELSDFGAKLDTAAPPKDDTYEATDALTGLLKQGLSALGGSTAQIG